MLSWLVRLWLLLRAWTTSRLPTLLDFTSLTSMLSLIRIGEQGVEAIAKGLCSIVEVHLRSRRSGIARRDSLFVR